MKALNRAYDVKETRPLWKRYVLAVGLTLLAGTVVLAAFGLLFMTQVFSEEIFSWLGVSGVGKVVFTILRWPAVVALMLAATAFLYWAAPNAKLPFKFITPGAVLFVVAWVIASTGFGLYVSNLGSYNATYGTLGGIVVLLLWFYLSSLIFLVGAELNAMLDSMAAEQGKKGGHVPVQGGPRNAAAAGGEQPRSAALRGNRCAGLFGVLAAALTIARTVRALRGSKSATTSRRNSNGTASRNGAKRNGYESERAERDVGSARVRVGGGSVHGGERHD